MKTWGPIVASFYAPRAVPQHRYDFLECLRAQRDTCRRWGLRQVVITDAPELGDLEVFSVPLPVDLMAAILTGQHRFLRDGPPGDVMLVGADCLIGADPRPLFDGTFDLAVTTHPFDDCILNTGLMAVSDARRWTTSRVWHRALALVGPVWGDDQLALASVLRPTLRHGVEDRDGLAVKFLPVPGYNDAPDDVRHALAALVLHFRGPRKAWMAEWLTRHPI